MFQEKRYSQSVPSTSPELRFLPGVWGFSPSRMTGEVSIGTPLSELIGVYDIAQLIV